MIQIGMLRRFPLIPRAIAAGLPVAGDIFLPADFRKMNVAYGGTFVPTAA